MQQTRKCLVIDDDKDDQEIFFLCLKAVDENIDCLAIHDPVEAITFLRSNEHYMPGYIFVDVNMPKMNGIECLRLLKEIQSLHETKIFMYSTTSDGTVVSESKEVGAHDFIIKPSKIAELKEKLAAIFRMA